MYLIWWAKTLVNNFRSKTKNCTVFQQQDMKSWNKINAWVFSNFSSFL